MRKNEADQFRRFESIIGDLLDISRIQAGKLELVYERTGLQSLIKESIDLVDLSGHQFTFDKLAEEIYVSIDRQKFLQVLVNLLANAIKYTPKGQAINITSSVVGQEAHIIVTDQGIGMEEKELKQIFSQFYRVSVVENKAKGIGLGLFIAKEIVEAHFGKIWAESEPGKGSSFHVTFPVNRQIP